MAQSRSLAHTARLGLIGLGLLLSACQSSPADPKGIDVSARQASPEAATGRYPQSSKTAAKVMVVTAHPLATQAALDILKQGGSAVDAAIAAQAVLGIVEPQSSGFGGGAFMVLASSKSPGTVLTFDGRETAPASANPKRFLSADGQPMGMAEALAKARAVGVPGVVAMLDAAHQRHGKLPWKTLLKQAIELAEEGAPVSDRLHKLSAQDPLLKHSPTARAVLLDPDGKPWPVWYTLKRPELAKLLSKLASDGPRSFYEGRLAKQMVEALRQAGSDITYNDWRSYQARVGSALCLPMKPYKACSAPPPSGGFSVLEMLALWQRNQHATGRPVLNAKQNDLSNDALHRLLEAQRLAFADRQQYSADPHYALVPVRGLLANSYLQQRARLIGELAAQGSVKPGQPVGASASRYDPQEAEYGTTHISIVDADGNWLGMTSSIEDSFGSRLMVKGLLMNNQLTDFSFQPGSGKALTANRVAGGKRPRSAMSPTIVLDANNRPVLVTGSPGGSRILGFNTRVLSGYLAGIDNPVTLVNLPHAVNRNGVSELENTLAAEVVDELDARGHQVKRLPMSSGSGVIVRRNNQLHGAADPRREGKADGY